MQSYTFIAPAYAYNKLTMSLLCPWKTRPQSDEVSTTSVHSTSHLYELIVLQVPLQLLPRCWQSVPLPAIQWHRQLNTARVVPSSSTTQRTPMHCTVFKTIHFRIRTPCLCFRPGWQLEMNQLQGSVFRLPNPSQIRRPDSRLQTPCAFGFHDPSHKMWYQRSQIIVKMQKCI